MHRTVFLRLHPHPNLSADSPTALVLFHLVRYTDQTYTRIPRIRFQRLKSNLYKICRFFSDQKENHKQNQNTICGVSAPINLIIRLCWTEHEGDEQTFVIPIGYTSVLLLMGCNCFWCVYMGFQGENYVYVCTYVCLCSIRRGYGYTYESICMRTVQRIHACLSPSIHISD